MKIINVAFVNKKLEKEVESISDKEFKDEIEKTIYKLKEKPNCGIHIPKDLWPKEYISKYDIKILYKYDLLNGWRLTYTIRGREIEVISIIIEWFCHKKYERKFKY